MSMSNLIFYYIFHDLRHRRTATLILCGVTMMGMLSWGLLAISNLTLNIKQYVQAGFHSARPIMGVIIATPKSCEEAQPQAIAELQEICKNNPAIEDISLVSLISELKTQDFPKIYNTQNRQCRPTIWAVAYGSKLLSSEYGFEFIQGGNFEKKPGRRFGVILTISFLEKYMNFKEEQITNIIQKKDLSQIPKNVYLHFWPIFEAKDFSSHRGKFEPGDLAISVSGIVNIRDENYPDIFITEDVAAAFYRLGADNFNPTYVLQFVDQESSKSLVPQENWKNIPWMKSAIVQLEPKEILLQRPKKYSHLWIWLKKDNIATPKIRRTIQVQLEQSLESNWEFTIPSDTVSDTLNTANFLVNIYSTAIVIIIMAISPIGILLFGLSYVNAKRRDIGVLKISAMNNLMIATILMAQILVIVITGFTIAIGFLLLTSYGLENYTQELVRILHPGSPLSMSKLDAWMILQSFSIILGCSIVGSIAPIKQAIQMVPMDDMNTVL